MAKIDISKLIGDNKNYSKLDLSPPPIAPPQAQGGNYRVVVGDSLKASETSMGQLSRALDNFAGPMMRSYAQLTEINEQEAIKEFDAMTDDAKQELLNKGDELNKELRKMGFKPNTAIETQRSIGEIGSSKFMSDWSQYWDQQIVDLQEDGSQITSDMMAQQWGQFRADYIANDEKLQKNVFAKEGFINITNDLWKRNQGTYLTTADNYYDQKVKIPALANNIKTAWEQNPEDIGTWWETHVKDFNKTEILDAIDHISKNATTLSDKIALQSFLTTATASKLSVGKSTFDKFSQMQLGTKKLDKDISTLIKSETTTDGDVRRKEANLEYQKAQGELALKLQQNRKLKNPRPESEILEEFRNEVADRNLNPETFLIFYGDIAAHIETIETKIENEILEDLNQSKIKAANAFAKYTNQIASARVRNEDVSGLVQEFETYLTTNPDKFDEALLSDGWKAFAGVDEDPTLRQVNSFTQRANPYPVSTGLQQAVDTVNEATGIAQGEINPYIFTKSASQDLKNIQGFRVDANSIELLQANAQETLIDYSNDISQGIPSAVAQEIIAENKARIIGDEIPPDLIPVYNKRLRERVAERKEEFKKDLLSIAKENQLAEEKANAEKAGMSLEQLQNYNKRVNAKDIENSLEKEVGNAYDLSFENGKLRLKIDDGWWRDVYDDGDEFPDNKLFNEFFVNRYLKANKLLTYVSPESKKENADLAKRALAKSGQLTSIGKSITSGEITIGETSIPSPYSPRPQTRRMTIDEEIAKRQEFQDLLTIRGVQDMIEDDLNLEGGITLSGVPLIGTVNDPTIGVLYGATNRIQTLPASYIHAIDDGTPITDFPKIQELADRLGVTATELVNNNRMILKRQGHVFPEDELQIQID